MKKQTAEILFQVDPWVIRHARLADAVLLRDYFELIADERPNNTVIRRAIVSLTPEAMRERIDRYEHEGNSAMFLAIHGGAVIGYVSLTGGSSPYSAHTVLLSINVHPDWRGRELGSALLRTALSWARSQSDVERIELEALTRNTDAIRLYERNGFKLEGVTRRAYRLVDEGDGETYVDAAHMAVLVDRRSTLERRRAAEFSAWDDQWS